MFVAWELRLMVIFNNITDDRSSRSAKQGDITSVLSMELLLLLFFVFFLIVSQSEAGESILATVDGGLVMTVKIGAVD